MRLLLVEDDTRIARFVAKGLREESYAVDAVENGSDAVYQTEINDYDLIVLDVMIPGIDGFAVCKAIRAGGINIVAIHSHMTHEQPRILFFHYWGRGPAKELAEAIKGALLAAGLSGVSTTAAK